MEGKLSFLFNGELHEQKVIVLTSWKHTDKVCGKDCDIPESTLMVENVVRFTCCKIVFKF